MLQRSFEQAPSGHQMGSPFSFLERGFRLMPRTQLSWKSANNPHMFSKFVFQTRNLSRSDEIPTTILCFRRGGRAQTELCWNKHLPRIHHSRPTKERASDGQE